MVPRTNRRSLVLWTLALFAGLPVTRAKADPLYTVTNLGSGDITFTTASDGTSSATSQYVSVSNGQVSYSFATTPDTPLVQGQGALSSVPASLNIAPQVYSSPEVAGYANANGFAALVIALPVSSFPSEAYYSAAAYPLGPDGQVAWGQGMAITSVPSDAPYQGIGAIGIAGVNTANQVLLGTNYTAAPYNGALVYNISTQSLTDLGTLPAITAGGYSNLMPIAIDNQGQVLVNATAFTPNGYVSDTLLLTPGGAPPEPLAAPEPGSCVLWAVIACASYLATKRALVTV